MQCPHCLISEWEVVTVVGRRGAVPLCRTGQAMYRRGRPRGQSQAHIRAGRPRAQVPGGGAFCIIGEEGGGGGWHKRRLKWKSGYRRCM